ncbi:MAG: hypothetical protein RQM95_10435 [Syntrophaceticus schinkii]
MSLARLLKKIESYYPNFDRELVERAYIFMQKRRMPASFAIPARLLSNTLWKWPVF